MQRATPPPAPVETYGADTPLMKVPGMRQTWASMFNDCGIQTLGAAQQFMANHANHRLDGDVELDLSDEFDILAIESDLIEAVLMSTPYMHESLRAHGFSPTVPPAVTEEDIVLVPETAQVASNRGKARSYIHGLLGI